MTPFDQFIVLLTPPAILTAILSGAALGWVICALRPNADHRFVTFLAVLLGVLVYIPQAAQLWFIWIATGEGVQPWATLGRWCLFTFAFVPSMSLAMRWRGR